MDYKKISPEFLKELSYPLQLFSTFEYQNYYQRFVSYYVL